MNNTSFWFFFLNRSVFGFCLSKVSRICFCWFWGWHMFFSLAATGWKGKVPEWPQFIPHSVWFLLTSFNVWNFQPLVCWWWFSTPRNLERFPQETYHEIAITDHQSDYRHLGGVIGFRPPKTHRLNYIDNQNKTPEYWSTLGSDQLNPPSKKGETQRVGSLMETTFFTNHFSTLTCKKPTKIYEPDLPANQFHQGLFLNVERKVREWNSTAKQQNQN